MPNSQLSRRFSGNSHLRFRKPSKRRCSSSGYPLFTVTRRLALEHIRSGRHTVVSTPTSSGKSLIYNLAVAEALIRDPDRRALYLFPIKALAHDQLDSLQHFFAALPGPEAGRVLYIVHLRRRHHSLPEGQDPAAPSPCSFNQPGYAPLRSAGFPHINGSNSGKDSDM